MRPRSRLLSTACILLATAGACSALIAFFPTDIPSASGTGIHPATLHGTIHVVGATTGFVLALISFALLTFWMSSPPVAARMPEITRLRRPIRIALAVAALGLVALATSIALAPRLLGLTERICLLGILAWVFIVALGLRRGGLDTAAPASRAHSTSG